ncbi:MAG TPA: glycosyltransferase family 2 protein, partial [Anaerolineae bacterium]|nr:glycosyltransferase family 2 protein [Anaerolineae bacterium]
MFISVIIPVHNGGETFRRCLEALNQTLYDQWECLVVDDNSTDGSAVVAQQYGARVIGGWTKRLGPAQARNIGAQMARGDVLFFLDADVLVQPGTVGHVAATM